MTGKERWAMIVTESNTEKQIANLLNWWENEGKAVHGIEVAKMFADALKERI